jgi:Predicted membrane protein
MFKQRTPRWILTGAFMLALGAGAINAVGFLGAHHQGISHMTGTVSLVGTRVAALEWAEALAALLMIVCFFAGAFLSGFVIRENTLRMGRRYGAVLTIEAAVLLMATYLFEGGSWTGAYFAAAACGIQNAMATSYSGAVIRSTHVTGIVTDVGIACGHALRGAKVDWARMRLYGVIFSGFALGGIAGAAGYLKFGYRMLYFPACLSGCTGLGYTLYKQWQRYRNTRAA